MKTKFNKAKFKEGAQQHSADLLAQIKAGVQAVRDSAGWTAWLRTAAKFVNYSVGNTWLIAIQCPGASRVAGFQAWKGLGRTVKKGEHGIAILAPILVKREVTKGNGDTAEKRALFFKTVFVFDVSQTEGQELPEIAPILEGSADDQLALLKDRAESFGFTVREEVLAEQLGGFVDTTKTITLNSLRPSRHRAKTLIHELAHGLLGHPGSGLPKDRMELEAETTAWIVSQQLGLESDEFSFGYLAGWSQTAVDFGAQLETSSENAFRVSRQILEALEASSETEKEAA